MLMKVYLQSYEMVTAGYMTNGSTPYWLHVLEVSWFGLVKLKRGIATSIPINADYKATIANWDNLIKTQQPLR